MLCLYFEVVVQLIVGHLNNLLESSYSISRSELTFPGACLLIFVFIAIKFENSLSQFSFRQGKAITLLSEHEIQDSHFDWNLKCKHATQCNGIKFFRKTLNLIPLHCVASFLVRPLKGYLIGVRIKILLI